MFDVVQASGLALEYEPIPAEQVLSGSPLAGSAKLHDFGGHDVGVWEHTVGTSTDVEADEVFVVLFGAATVSFDDGRVIALGTGSVGRLVEGEKTVWTVTETLRKVYVA